MTELEPPLIGDELMRERAEELGEAGFVGAYNHWLPGAPRPEWVPGAVHLDAARPTYARTISPSPDVPMLDLSWTPPDVDAVLRDILDRVGLLPDPEPMTKQEWVAALHDALGWPPDELPVLTDITGLVDPDWTGDEPVTQELKTIQKEEQ